MKATFFEFNSPKNPWNLEWKGLNLYSSPGPQNSYFLRVPILRVEIWIAWLAVFEAKSLNAIEVADDISRAAKQIQALQAARGALFKDR